MPRWTVYLRIMFVTPKRTNKYIPNGRERHRVVAEAERLEAGDEQHRNDRGGERHRFAERHAVVAVEVGQHAGEAAHRAGDDRRVGRHAVAEAEHAGIAAAEHGARTNMHAKAGHRCSFAIAAAPAANRLDQISACQPRVLRLLACITPRTVAACARLANAGELRKMLAAR